MKYIIDFKLFNVSYKETVKLMTLFQTYWHKRTTKHKAFSQAPKEMRNKYPPYQWAEFIFVE